MTPLVRVAVERPVSVTMTAIAVAAFGVVGYSRLSLELLPDISYPSVTIETTLPDTAPYDIESLITRPVEEAVGVLRGLQTIHSVSRSGVSEVTLQFDWGTDMDLVSLEVREKLDRIILPETAESPIVLRFDPSLDPILRIALSSEDDLLRTRYYADRRLKPDFETIEGVASAQLRGGFEEEIHVYVDQERLAALGISMDRVWGVVGASNINVPGGALRGADNVYIIRTVNEFDDIEEIRELEIWRSGDAVVRLGEVADVVRGTKDRDEITRVDGKESVEISIYKEGDGNTVAVARAVRERLAYWSERLPPGHRLTVLFDQSGFIEDSVNGVKDAALVGGALAVAVLLLFLRDVRSTLIVATSIPLSVVATFLFMYRFDISLNVMSLGGLTLGIGMLVDNSIVVLESIFRRRSEGAGLREAAISGTAEVGPAVFASTMTTVAVFLPIVFVEGVAGQLFRDQALTVTISLLASLCVALTLIPMLAAVGARRRSAREAAPVALGESVPAATLGFVSRVYDGLVRGAIRLRWLVLLLAAGMFALAVVGAGTLGTELIPQLSEGEFFFEVHLPEGASIRATDEIVERMETAASADPLVARHYSTVGSRLVSGGMSLQTRAENLGQLSVVLDEGADRAAEDEVAERLREVFHDIPDLEVKFGRPSYFSLETPVEVIVYGEDPDQLRELAATVAERLSQVPGLVDVRSSLEEGNPEVSIRFDRRRLAALGLAVSTLSETLRSRVQGVIPTQFREEDRLIDIRVRNRESTRETVEDIRQLVVTGPGGEPLRLLAVADVEIARGPAEIHRLQQQRAAVITANVDGVSLGAALTGVKDLIGPGGIPDLRSVSTELGGQNREMEVSFVSLRFAIGLAMFLVYLVMASTFESFLHPFIVLFTVPLSLIGAVAGLVATSTSVSVIVLIGAILLVGIVVNNAIVLIDMINRLRRAGVDRVEAVVRAGHVRLRPILMTTLTTILGLLPMALGWGQGAELRAPLAITVASGLAVSTLLTLVVIPAVYMVFPDDVSAERSDEVVA